MWQRAVLVSQPTHPDLYDHDTRQRLGPEVAGLGDGMGMVPMVRACLFLEVDETWEHGKTFDKTAKGC